MEDINDEEFAEYIDVKEIIAEIEAMPTDDELFDTPFDDVFPRQTNTHEEIEEVGDDAEEESE